MISGRIFIWMNENCRFRFIPELVVGEMEGVRYSVQISFCQNVLGYYKMAVISKDE